MSTVTDAGSVPIAPEDTSKGSSVSSGFINEYEEILKFAVVAPKLQIAGNGFVDIDKNYHKNKNDSKIADGPFDISGSSNDSSSSSSPPPFETGKTIQDGNVEIKVIEARKAVNQTFKMKDIDKSRQQKMSNAMETLLETPKETKSILRRNLDSSGSTPGSVAEEFPSPSIDKDLIRMDNAMDDWCLQLKRNVLSELADMKKKQLLYQEQKLDQMKAKYNAKSLHANHEAESMKELLYTFEQSVKQKDEVITNLTAMLNKQKKRCEKIRIFSVWRLKHNDAQSQVFALKMAEKFHKRSLMSKVWAGWRGVVENTWKRRVEKACQIKSQEICLKLTEDYEERLQALQRELAATRAEVAKMHTERDCYEENMKKAFMRGVCALNMEAMSMFKENQEVEDHEVEPPPHQQQQHFSLGQQFERADQRSTVPRQPSTKIFNPTTSSTSSASSNTINNNTSTKKTVRFDDNLPSADSTKSRTSSAYSSEQPSQRKSVHVKMTGKKDYGALKKHGGSQSSTISSIKVERHQPIQHQQHQQQPLLRPQHQSRPQHSQHSSRLSSKQSTTTMRNNASNSVIVD